MPGRPRRRLGWLVAFVVVSLLVSQLGATPARADHDLNHVLQRIKELERAIQISRQNAERFKRASQQYQSAAAAAAARIQQLARQQEAAESEADEVAAEIAIAEEQLALVTLQLNETIAYLEALNAAIDEGTKLLAHREQLYAQHLRQLYRQSRATPLEMLLASRSLADFAERVQLLSAIARQDQQLASDIRRLKASNEEKKVTAELKQKEIEGLKVLVTVQRDRLKAQQAQLDALIDQTAQARAMTAAQRDAAARNAQQAQNLAKKSQLEAADLERKKLAAEALYAELAARLQSSSGLTVPWSGRLALWPLSGYITSSYGPRRGGFHNGIDLAAPMYTPIHAAHPGRVQVAGKPYLAVGDTATVVIIAHASNMSTLYGHLDDAVRPPPVTANQWVQAGQVIGYVGMTGWTTGPHLHFMTVYNARAVNPLQFLP